jgi:RHS repeat-associated protein
LGSIIIFHYDFDGNIIGESNLSGTFSKEYLYRGNNRLAMVETTTGEIYFYGNDKQGTPIILTDSTNTVVWEAFYKPFGKALVNPNSSIINNFRFEGQYYDQETGFHYNYHRYYDPGIGIYLTPDPKGFDTNNNLFVYVENNPINAVDPLGLFSFTNPISYWKDLYDYALKQRQWGHATYPGEEHSSMRHCVVSCMTAQNFGGAGAFVAGAANEFQGYFRWDLPTMLSAVTGIGSVRYKDLGWGRLTGNVPFAFQIKDFIDNQRGINCSIKINEYNNRYENESSESSCIKCCQGK